jgi:hypothetical protein
MKIMEIIPGPSSLNHQAIFSSIQLLLKIVPVLTLAVQVSWWSFAQVNF